MRLAVLFLLICANAHAQSRTHADILMAKLRLEQFLTSADDLDTVALSKNGSACVEVGEVRGDLTRFMADSFEEPKLGGEGGKVVAYAAETLRMLDDLRTLCKTAEAEPKIKVSARFTIVRDRLRALVSAFNKYGI